MSRGECKSNCKQNTTAPAPRFALPFWPGAKVPPPCAKSPIVDKTFHARERIPKEHKLTNESLDL